MNSNPVQNYILKSEHNLGIAAAVGEAWPEVRQKLVSGFLDNLESRLRKKLKGWEYGQYGQFFVDADTGFYFYKPKWENQYSIGLQFRDRGERNIIGVVRDTPDRVKRSFCKELADAIRDFYPSATTHAWWEARATLDSFAPDWRKPEVLWLMKRKDGKLLDETAEQLLVIAKKAEPFIDRLVRKYKQ